MADRKPNPNDFDRSQLKKAEPIQKPQVIRTRVKDAASGKTVSKFTKTPEKAAADKAAGKNSNIGKVIKGSQGAKFDFTEVKPTSKKQREAYAKNRAEHTAKIAANKAKAATKATPKTTAKPKPMTEAQKQSKAMDGLMAKRRAESKKTGSWPNYNTN